jgi:pimeloyl-ACP methyl ester carboxylesterase
MEKMKLLIFILLFVTSGCSGMPIQTVTEKDEYVILLHGLARTSRSMNSLGRYLSRQGFKVLNIDYPSRKYPIQKLAEYVGNKVKQHHLEMVSKVHLVTHSLGGIVARWYLKDKPLDNLGFVVMLSPPNQGSELVDILKDNFLFQFIMGPAGQQLGTTPTSIPNQLGAVDFPLGVITGNVSINPIFSHFLPGEDDGAVSVERAKVEGMKDFLVVPYSHSFIMNRREVMQQVAYFLGNGHFSNQTQDKN